MSKAYVIDKIDEQDVVGVMSFYQGAGVEMQPFVFNATERQMVPIDGADLDDLFGDIADWCERRDIQGFFRTADELDEEELDRASSFGNYGEHYLTESDFATLDRPAVYNQTDPADREVLERIGFEIPDYAGIKKAFKDAGFSRADWDETVVCFENDYEQEISFDTWADAAKWVQGESDPQNEHPEIQRRVAENYKRYCFRQKLADTNPAYGVLRDYDLLDTGFGWRRDRLAEMAQECGAYLNAEPSPTNGWEFLSRIEEAEQINLMKALYESLPDFEKHASRIKMDNIKGFAERMGVDPEAPIRSFKDPRPEREQMNAAADYHFDRVGDGFGRMPQKPAIDAGDVLDRHNIADTGYEYRRMLLSRMEQDCKYWLGFGSAADKHLWAGNPPEQIAVMKALYESLPEGEKPEWITMDHIDNYAEHMGVRIQSEDERTVGSESRAEGAQFGRSAGLVGEGQASLNENTSQTRQPEGKAMKSWGKPERREASTPADPRADQRMAQESAKAQGRMEPARMQEQSRGRQ